MACDAALHDALLAAAEARDAALALTVHDGNATRPPAARPPLAAAVGAPPQPVLLPLGGRLADALYPGLRAPDSLLLGLPFLLRHDVSFDARRRVTLSPSLRELDGESMARTS